jgi:solute carrier family 35, member E1
MDVGLIVTGFLWFIPASLLSTWANTTFLLAFKDPVLHTLIRFWGSAIIGTSTLVGSGTVKPNEVFKVVKDVAVPAALLWVANYANSMALQESGITLTYVIKSGIPVFTVLICTAMGQKFSKMVYISLIPICFGVALACMGDMNFSTMGVTAGLTSTIAQTCLNISIKSVRTKTGYSGMKAFMGMAIVCSVLSVPMALLSGMVSDATPPLEKLAQATAAGMQGDYWPITLVAAASLAYHIEYALNFMYVGFVSSVAFSVSDIARRVAIIVMGSIVFNKQLTQMNWVGIIIALSGVLWYSYLENQSTVKAKVK